MRKIIEDAIIIETIEREPSFSIEVVYPEVIRERRKGLLESILELFTGNSLYEDSYEENEYYADLVNSEPEIAIITEYNERPVNEIHYFYFELEQ